MSEPPETPPSQRPAGGPATSASDGGDPRDGVQPISRGGAELLLAWSQTLRIAGLYSLDSRAMIPPIEGFVRASHELIRSLGALTLEVRGDTLTFNGAALPRDDETTAAIADVFALFERWRIASFDLEQPLSSSAVRKLLEILVYDPDPDHDFGTLVEALAAAELPVRVRPLREEVRPQVGDPGGDPVDAALATHSTLIAWHHCLLEHPDDLELRRTASRRISRAVQTLVDLCLENPQALLIASTVRVGDAYAPRHAANVAVLAVAVGQLLGLARVDLADLGLAAMLHDIGMSRVDPAVLEKEGPLDAEERTQVEAHTLSSVELLLEVSSLTLPELRQIVVAFEHHHAMGGGDDGFGRPTIFSRIVAVADTYDALTTDRPWRRALPPPEALEQLLAEAGKRFDPIVVKTFARAVGTTNR